MMSEPMSKVLALLICCSIFISPVCSASNEKTLEQIEEERLRAILAENKKAAERRKSTNYAG